jgi:predicted alpha-1,6-mannanase (GH76 family)
MLPIGNLPVSWGGVWSGACGQLTPDNQALYIALYAELGHLTSNTTATDLAKDAIKKAFAASAPWNNAQGIIKEGKGNETVSDDAIGFKSILIRYLQKSIPWLQDDDLTNAITEYVNIQYYALSQLDSDDKNKPLQFGRNWEGPYSSSTDHAQL